MAWPLIKLHQPSNKGGSQLLKSKFIRLFSLYHRECERRSRTIWIFNEINSISNLNHKYVTYYFTKIAETVSETNKKRANRRILDQTAQIEVLGMLVMALTIFFYFLKFNWKERRVCQLSWFIVKSLKVLINFEKWRSQVALIYAAVKCRLLQQNPYTALLWVLVQHHEDRSLAV